ncbi:MAG: antibiotic biosynthesis monooxygenase [Acidobacteria bacterium]|nr:antibiotic biosynthesis monooxygenase [Acidobacteriota bacterium]
MILEQVVYRIKPSCRSAFHVHHNQVVEALAGLPGFVSLTLWTETKDPDVRADHVVWDDEESAMAAHQVFSELAGAQEMMKAVDTVFHSAHFRELLSSE